MLSSFVIDIGSHKSNLGYLSYVRNATLVHKGVCDKLKTAATQNAGNSSSELFQQKFQKYAQKRQLHKMREIQSSNYLAKVREIMGSRKTL